jgi:hypothetical protein
MGQLTDPWPRPRWRSQIWPAQAEGVAGCLDETRRLLSNYRKCYLDKAWSLFQRSFFRWTVGADLSALHSSGIIVTREAFLSNNLPAQQNAARQALLHPPAHSDPDSAATWPQRGINRGGRIGKEASRPDALTPLARAFAARSSGFPNDNVLLETVRMSPIGWAGTVGPRPSRRGRDRRGRQPGWLDSGLGGRLPAFREEGADREDQGPAAAGPACSWRHAERRLSPPRGTSP